jgi:hypothetical protein
MGPSGQIRRCGRLVRVAYFDEAVSAAGWKRGAGLGEQSRPPLPADGKDYSKAGYSFF